MPGVSHSQDLEMMPRARSLAAASAHVGTVVLVLLSAWLIFNWVETVERIVRYYTPLPVWDYWRTVADLPFYKSHDFRILWHQHNEHRIIFPEIVFATDYLLFHGCQVMPMAISFLCYAGNWIVLAWAFSNATAPRFVRALGILLAGIIIGWQGSAVVLSDTFLLQWTLSQLAVLVSLAFLARTRETGRNVYLTAVIISAVVATYSSGNGLLLWPILAGAGLVLAVRPRQMVALVIAGVISDGMYFVGYQFTGTLSFRKVLEHPLYSMEWMGAYLSMPFGAIKSAEFGVCVGLASIFIVAILAIIAARKHLLASRAGIVLFGFYLFSLATALLTAAGRIDPADPGFSTAKPPRYVLGPLVTWAVFILLCLWLTWQLYTKAIYPYCAAFLIATLLLLGLPKLRWWLRGADADHANQQLATLAVGLEIQDPTVELNIFPDPPGVDFWTPWLRENRSSVFYKGLIKWLGKPAGSFAALTGFTVRGEITYTFPVLDGVEVAGWVDAADLRGGARQILLTNENGQIAGFGAKLPSGFPSVAENPRTPPSLGWVGFVNLSCPTKTISAYAVNPRGLFRIEGSVPVPTVQVTQWERAGPRIQGIQWQMDPSWTANNIAPRAPFSPGQGPSRPFYSSWSGSDANTGRISSSIFPAPANACLILPVLQGPRAGGLAAEVVDADSGRILASVPFQNTLKQWVFWRLPLDASAKRLRVIGEDRGKSWGEWLAVGNPLLCR